MRRHRRRGLLGLGLFFLLGVAAQAQADSRPHCLKYAARLGSVVPADCDADFIDTGARSVDGEPLLLRHVPATGVHGRPTRVLIVGGIHGDELSSISIVFRWLRELDRDGPNEFEWHILPSMNPDGVLNRPSRRTNRNGVDLNRNLPTPNWHTHSANYWVHETSRNPRRYPGPEPLSEPETRWLYDEIAVFQPDALVVVHAPYGVVDFDGPSLPPKRLGALHLNLLGTYPGSVGNFAGVQLGIPVITVELKHAGIMPPDREQVAIWHDLLSWLRDHILPTDYYQAQRRPIAAASDG